MDFQSLSRRDLQTLCKKNKIPANITNVAMGNALQALEFVEGIDELQNPGISSAPQLPPESPEKKEARSPDLPQSCRRTSSRIRALQASVPSKENGTKDLLLSPLPPTQTHRRAAAKASSACRRVCKEEEPEKEESSGLQQILQENNGPEIPKTPAACHGCKRAAGTSVRQKIKSQVEEKEKENPAATGLRTYYSTRRSARLSEKRLQETAPLSIRKSRGIKQVITIAALSEECEESEMKLKEGFETSKPDKDGQDTSASLVLPQSDMPVPDKEDEDPPPTVEGFNGEKCESDALIADGCDSKKCDSETMADTDLRSIDSAHKNLDLGDAAPVLLSESSGSISIEDLGSPLSAENYHDKASSGVAAMLEDLKSRNFFTAENQATSEGEGSNPDSVHDAELDDDQEELNSSTNKLLPECDESGTDPDADADLHMDPVKNIETDAGNIGQEASDDASGGANLVASPKQNEKFGKNVTDSGVETGSAVNAVKEIGPIKNLEKEGRKISQEASDDDAFGGETLVTSPNQNEKFGENVTDGSVETGSVVAVAKEDGESGNDIADSSSSVASSNPEGEHCDSEPKFECVDLTSSMKNLTLDCQYQFVENAASIESSTQALISDEIMPPEIAADSDSSGDNLNIMISTEIPDQSLIGTPSSSWPNNFGALRSGKLLGSKSHSKLKASNKETGTPIKCCILEDDVDKENKGGESIKRETKANNKGVNKEQLKGGSLLNDMSMRQLKKLLKNTKSELVKRSALQAVNENRQVVESGN